MHEEAKDKDPSPDENEIKGNKEGCKNAIRIGVDRCNDQTRYEHLKPTLEPLRNIENGYEGSS